uniref:Uncharacterized protein n=1 Tax=Setaria italica TaxID=4555 RepID=K3ZEN5_SETIT
MNSASSSQYTQGGKHKRYISYDLYVDNTLNVTDKDDALKMGTFKAKHKIVREASYGDLSWEYKLIGHLLTRSLLKAVEEHMAAGLCFHRFKWPEIVLTRDGQVLFKQVGTIPSSPDARKHTMEDDVGVVEYLIKLKNIPTDLPELYTIHASLVPLNNRGWGYIHIYEKVKNKISASEFRNILLKIPYHGNWRAQVQQNLIMQETYHFVPGCYDSQPGNKTAIEEQLESANLFLDFLRNGTSHRAQRSLITLPSHFELITTIIINSNKIISLFHLHLYKLLQSQISLTL